MYVEPANYTFFTVKLCRYLNKQLKALSNFWVIKCSFALSKEIKIQLTPSAILLIKTPRYDCHFMFPLQFIRLHSSEYQKYLYMDSIKSEL